MIDAQNITKAFAGNKVLKGLSFCVPKGQVTGLVGPNGSGKSTAIRILTGFIEADRGEVTVNGHPMGLHAMTAKRLIGYAPEHSALYREMTTKEQLEFVCGLRGLDKRQAKRDIDAVVCAFSLESIYYQATGTLSKGYRHRVSLAQSLIGDPPIVILDEPTDGLDPIQKLETQKMIESMARDKAVLLTSHQLEEINLLCHRVVALHEGVAAFEGTLAEVFSKVALSRDIRLGVVGIAKKQLHTLLCDMEGLEKLSFDQAGDVIVAQLRFEGDQDEADIRNRLSLKVSQSAARVLELTSEKPSINQLFNYWNQGASNN